MPHIKLQSSDGKVFEVDIEVAKASKTIKTMIEYLVADDEEVVTLPYVNSSTLRKVIQWATQHQGDPPPQERAQDGGSLAEDIPPWDADFLRDNRAALPDLIQAANYLDIKELLIMACRSAANTIKGLNPEDVRKVFNIPDDLTTEEKERFRKENAWCNNN